VEWVTTTLLLDQLGKADQNAWARFVTRFQPLVLHFAKKLGVHDADAEDVAQETMTSFLKSYRANGYDRTKGRLSSWLFSIAYRRVRDLQRKRYAGPAEVLTMSRIEQELDEASAHDTWESEWRLAVARAALEQVRMEVSPNTMAAFEAVVLEGAPAAEVAERLGMTSNAVYIAKHRTLKRLRALEREVSDD
jgi:RNA polymerase sigma-70 factor (ECF subfamily)